MVSPKIEFPGTADLITVTENNQLTTKPLIGNNPFDVFTLLDGDQALPNGDRMIVVVDHQNVSEADFARMIWSIASPAHLNVLYLSLVNSNGEQMTAERRLASLASITKDAWVKVEIRVIRGNNWIKVIRQIWKPGDIVICHAEQMVSSGWFKHEPLATTLISNQTTPVYIFSGIYEKPQPLLKHRLLSIPYWFALVAIIAGFFEMEALVYQSENGVAGIILVFLLFLIELGLIWIWNSIQI